jgi:hypothetical protein
MPSPRTPRRTPTGPQESYLTTLAQEAGEDVDISGLNKAEASQKIDELKQSTGR